jgi:regulatory protein
VEGEISILVLKRSYNGPLPYCRLQLTGGREFILDLGAGENLSQGEQVDAGALAHFARQDLLFRLLRKGLELASLREHSRFELQQKLVKRFDRSSRSAEEFPELLSAALDRLEGLGYLNDRRFAESWVLRRLSRRGEGAGLLRRGLGVRGIGRELAGEVLEKCLTPGAETAALEKAVLKLSRRGFAGEELRRRLLGLGFNAGRVRAFLSGDGE